MDFRPLFTERLSGFREWLRARDPRHFAEVLAAALIVGLTLIICSAYLPSRHSYTVGETVAGTIIASHTVTYEDKAATEQLRQQAAAQTSPVFSTNPGALASATEDIKAFYDQLRQVRATGSPNTGSSAGQAAIAKVRAFAPSELTDADISYLLGAGSDVLAELEQQAINALSVVYSQTVIDASVPAQKEFLRSFATSLPFPAAAQAVLAHISSGYLRANAVLDQQATALKQAQAAQAVQPVVVTVIKGQHVLEAGSVISAGDLAALEALGLARARVNWKIWLGVLLVVLFEVLIAGMYLYRFGRGITSDNNLMLVAATLFLLFALLSRLLSIPPLSAYIIPLAALGMLATIIFNARTGHLMVALAALNVGLMTGMDLNFALVALLTGALSLYLVSHLNQRSQLVSSGIWIMVAGAVAVFAAELLRESPLPDALRSSLWGVGNGLLSMVLTLILLVVFETAFNLTTPLRLLELANPAQPLLRRLMQVAPGTYNHSIMMGNLAESAAEAIGADPLLARVGAYYHDIGKINRPEYFIENQLHMSNPHDRLSPNLSRLAIMAHVRDGEELARENGLPQPVVDIIKQHHGTSVLTYFYQKAQQTSQQAVPEEEFRYEEEKPTSREAAIIMLADSVEAATKSMRHPTFKKLQGLIHEIFRQKMEDGQLDRSQLTFGDLQRIGEVFENGLRGMMGHRIEYPWQRESRRGEPRPPVPASDGDDQHLPDAVAQAAVDVARASPAPSTPEQGGGTAPGLEPGRAQGGDGP